MTTADASNSRALTPKGIATRDRILRAAAGVLLQGGLSAFSLERVRQAASVSGSQISHYFDDRQDLVRAVIGRQIDGVLDFHRQPALGGLDTFDDWEAWANLNVRYLRRIGYRGTATYHVLAGQLAKTDAETRATFSEGYTRWVNLLEDSFARMRSRGALVKSADPLSLARTVVALHQGAGVMAFTYRREWPLVEVTRFAVNYIRLFASDPGERQPRRAGRARGRSRPARPPELPDETFTRKGRATRARIVEGAAELFLERGVAATSLDDVRRSVGVSGSQISHYFVDKRDLVRQVIAARTAFVLDFHHQPELGDLDSLRSLRRWADLCWAQAGEGYVRTGCVYGSLTGELLEADDDVLDDLANGYDEWVALFRTGLTSMIERGELSPETLPDHLAVAIVAAHQGGTMLTHITGSAAPFKAAVEAALEYVASYAPPTTARNHRQRTRVQD